MNRFFVRNNRARPPLLARAIEVVQGTNALAQRMAVGNGG